MITGHVPKKKLFILQRSLNYTFMTHTYRKGNDVHQVYSPQLEVLGSCENSTAGPTGQFVAVVLQLCG